MNLFQKTLEQLSNKILGAANYKKDVADEISKLLGVKILEDQITIKEKTIYIKVSPTIKTALILKKNSILDFLKKHNINIIG